MKQMPFSEDVQNVISIVLFVMRILVPALKHCHPGRMLSLPQAGASERGNLWFFWKT